MYLEMIFVKIKEQTIWQLQFKFDPLPTESAGICLYHERWIKTFYTQPFGQLCIKYVLVFYKIDLLQFCKKIYGRSFTKKPHFEHSRNRKCIFRAKKMQTPLGNIVWNSKMHRCAQYEII